ncbi:MAG TPA: L,D-transpeptidase family protein [Pyrinomonadaceae bacterium]|nr:L,D-transpeptidase family protein [Pyrinomonadaceae bacterium]
MRSILRRLMFAGLLATFLSTTSLTSLAARRQVKAQAVGAAQILEAEERLASLGYWTGPIDGKFDSGSRHALIAFQKVEGRNRTGKLTIKELEALRAATRPSAKYTDYAHVEVDLERQVLFIVNDEGVVTHIVPVCTGNEKLYTDQGEVHRAHTPRGKFTVLRKINGVRISSLGFLYYPNYIYGGIAIHGSWSVKAYPDSHGCIRIPMSVAKEFSSLVPVGMIVVVF